MIDYMQDKIEDHSRNLLRELSVEILKPWKVVAIAEESKATGMNSS